MVAIRTPEEGYEGINGTIWQILSENNRDVEERYLTNNMDNVRRFLIESDLEKRRRLAIKISREALAVHHKRGLNPILKRLATIETGVQIYYREYRDHPTMKYCQGDIAK